MKGQVLMNFITKMIGPTQEFEQRQIRHCIESTASGRRVRLVLVSG